MTLTALTEGFKDFPFYPPEGGREIPMIEYHPLEEAKEEEGIAKDAADATAISEKLLEYTKKLEKYLEAVTRISAILYVSKLLENPTKGYHTLSLDPYRIVVQEMSAFSPTVNFYDSDESKINLYLVVIEKTIKEVKHCLFGSKEVIKSETLFDRYFFIKNGKVEKFESSRTCAKGLRKPDNLLDLKLFVEQVEGLLHQFDITFSSLL